MSVGKKEKEKIAHNGLWLCVRFFAYSECLILAQCFKAKTDAKPLLSAVFLRLFKSELLTIKYKKNVKRTINNL